MDSNSESYGYSGGLDEDLLVPRTVMVKILKDILPPGILVAKDTYDLITECGTEFVHLLSSQSVDVCEKAKRGIMTGDHVMEALRNLGFGAFIPVLRETHEQYEKLHEEHEKKRKSFSKWGSLTEEQLDEMAQKQQRMFEEAKLSNSCNGGTSSSPIVSTPVVAFASPAPLDTPSTPALEVVPLPPQVSKPIIEGSLPLPLVVSEIKANDDGKDDEDYD